MRRLATEVDERRNPRTNATVNQLFDRHFELAELEENTRANYRSLAEKHIRPLIGTEGRSHSTGTCSTRSTPRCGVAGTLRPAAAHRPPHGRPAPVCVAIPRRGHLRQFADTSSGSRIGELPRIVGSAVQARGVRSDTDVAQGGCAVVAGWRGCEDVAPRGRPAGVV
jgi:hypothetical protein